MLRHRRIRANTIRIHQRDQFRLRQIPRRRRRTLLEQGFRGRKLLPEFEVGEARAALPAVVRVHGEEVPFRDDQAFGAEQLRTILQVDGGAGAARVGRAAGEEPAGHELVDAPGVCAL